MFVYSGAAEIVGRRNGLIIYILKVLWKINWAFMFTSSACAALAIDRDVDEYVGRRIGFDYLCPDLQQLLQYQYMPFSIEMWEDLWSSTTLGISDFIDHPFHAFRSHSWLPALYSFELTTMGKPIDGSNSLGTALPKETPLEVYYPRTHSLQALWMILYSEVTKQVSSLYVYPSRSLLHSL